jgi:hypothetical protein
MSVTRFFSMLHHKPNETAFKLKMVRTRQKYSVTKGKFPEFNALQNTETCNYIGFKKAVAYFFVIKQNRAASAKIILFLIFPIHFILL